MNKGDFVIYKRKHQKVPYLSIGLMVINTAIGESVGVNWGPEFDGHRCEGLLKNKTGWYIDKNNLEVVPANTVSEEIRAKLYDGLAEQETFDVEGPATVSVDDWISTHPAYTYNTLQAHSTDNATLANHTHKIKKDSSYDNYEDYEL